MEDIKKYLKDDEADKSLNNDFGKNIIPKMIVEGDTLVAYPFKGYWKDVVTTESLWQANVDLLKEDNELSLNDEEWRIYSGNSSAQHNI